MSFKYRKSLQLLNDNIRINLRYPPPVAKDDLLITRRIIENYTRANANNIRDIYKLHPLWYESIYKSRIHYVESLRRGEAYHLSVLLNSFFRNIGSVGITYRCKPFRVPSKLNYSFVIEIDKMYQKLRSKERNSRIFFNHLINTNDVGNPYLVRLYGLSLDINTLYYLSHLYEIIQHTEFVKNGEYVFVDLGPGFRGTMKFLLQLFPNSKVIIFDIPEMLPFSTFFLCKNFANKKIGLYTDITNLKEDIMNYDILLLPHFMIDEIPSEIADCFVNTASLPEMKRDLALHYLNTIKRAVKHNGIFYSNNNWDNAARSNLKGEHGMKELFEASSMENNFDIICNDILEITQGYRRTILRKR